MSGRKPDKLPAIQSDDENIERIAIGEMRPQNILRQ